MRKVSFYFPFLTLLITITIYSDVIAKMRPSITRKKNIHQNSMSGLAVGLAGGYVNVYSSDGKLTKPEQNTQDATKSKTYTPEITRNFDQTNSNDWNVGASLSYGYTFKNKFYLGGMYDFNAVQNKSKTFVSGVNYTSEFTKFAYNNSGSNRLDVVIPSSPDDGMTSDNTTSTADTYIVPSGNINQSPYNDSNHNVDVYYPTEDITNSIPSSTLEDNGVFYLNSFSSILGYEYNINQEQLIMPFVKAGYTLARQSKFDLQSNNEVGNGFNIGFGIAYSPYNNLYTSLEYSYTGIYYNNNKVTLNDNYLLNGKTDFGFHNIKATIGVKFNI
jgi:hypothetical protein